MTPEVAQVPLTAPSVRAVNRLALETPASPVIVPLGYDKVTVPGALGECIQGVIRNPRAFMLDHNTAPLEKPELTADEHGEIYDGISPGLTLRSLLAGIPEDTLTLWALHLNLADPLMPSKLREFHRQRMQVGLVAVVIPSLASVYARALEEMEPVIVYPKDNPPAVSPSQSRFHRHIET